LDIPFQTKDQLKGEFYQKIIELVERHLIEKALREVGNNQVNAAELLGINRITLRKRIKDFGLEYEAYSLDFNIYFSDCCFFNLHRWHPSMFDWNELKPGDRIQILIHPQHWRE
jgi:hypothetical protein